MHHKFTKVVLGVESRISCMSGHCSTNKLYTHSENTLVYLHAYENNKECSHVMYYEADIENSYVHHIY